MLIHSNMHTLLNWAKERIDEMDAVLTSTEAKAALMTEESKRKAQQIITLMKKHRHAFESILREQVQAGEVALEQKRDQLESHWNDFQSEVMTYFTSVGEHIDHQQAAFEEVAAAQLHAWKSAADTFSREAAKIAAAQRAEVNAAVKQMTVDAAEVKARLRKIGQLGNDTWSGLSVALAESRKAFDQANQSAGEALRRASRG